MSPGINTYPPIGTVVSIKDAHYPRVTAIHGYLWRVIPDPDIRRFVEPDGTIHNISMKMHVSQEDSYTFVQSLATNEVLPLLTRTLEFPDDTQGG